MCVQLTVLKQILKSHVRLCFLRSVIALYFMVKEYFTGNNQDIQVPVAGIVQL